MKHISFVIGFCICFIACNQTQTKKQTLPVDSTHADSLKVNDKALTDSFPDFETEDTNYQKANISMTMQDWQRFKATYKLDDKDFSMYDKKSYGPEMIKGDFNGDGEVEYMMIVLPRLRDTLGALGSQQCYGGCNSVIVFSNTSLPILKVINNLGGPAVNVGDLDGDGADEILVFPDWWQSNWNAYKVFSLNKETAKWNYIIKPVSIFANELERDVLVKRSTHAGFVSAYTSTSDKDGNIKSGYKDFEIIKQ